ncbi:hypothetical protein GC197_09355 [bacterium]|nr:hypothetical protein [bacterium]
MGTRKEVFIASLDGKIIRDEAEPALAEDARVLMCNYDKDSWATVIGWPKKKTLDVWWGSPAEDRYVEVSDPNQPNLVGGPGFFAIYSGNAVRLGFSWRDELALMVTDQRVNHVAFEPPVGPRGTRFTTWLTTWNAVEIRPNYFVQFYPNALIPWEYDGYHVYLASPAAQRLVTHGPGGRTQVFQLRGDPDTPRYKTAHAIWDLMDLERYDAIQALGKRWENRVDCWSGRTNATAYWDLIWAVIDYRREPKTMEQRAERLAEIVKKHPDNEVLRIALAELYVYIGTAARGSSSAYKVTAEGWRLLDLNISKAWKTLKPLMEKDHVPPEAYSVVTIIAQYGNWENERIDSYLKRAMDECPHNVSLWAHVAVARLPRWGGRLGESEKLTAQAADKVGGKEGDILYAEVSRGFFIYYGWPDFFSEAGFDKERVMRGMVGICERSPNMYATNQALILAKILDDHESAHKIAKVWNENHFTYIHRLWDWDLPKFHKVMKWAEAESPPKKEETGKSEAKPEPAK